MRELISGFKGVIFAMYLMAVAFAYYIAFVSQPPIPANMVNIMSYFQKGLLYIPLIATALIMLLTSFDTMNVEVEKKEKDRRFKLSLIGLVLLSALILPISYYLENQLDPEKNAAFQYETNLNPVVSVKSPSDNEAFAHSNSFSFTSPYDSAHDKK